jgi:hypothetical protein
MRHFCTYFDHRYLPHGLALYESLSQHCAEFRLWVLCLDTRTHESLRALKLSKIDLITLGELESGDKALCQAKTNRSLVEYYFTCTPSLPLFILRNNPAMDLITYLDADLFFFSSVEPLFNEIADHSIAIIAHKFSPRFQEAERFGIFNVGWVTFIRDDEALSCLQRWREECLKWCTDRSDGSRFADQKYLDDWPTRFQNVVVLQHKGANLAAWNLANYNISVRDAAIYVDDEPLIFFHFHGLKRLSGYVYNTHLQHYGATPSKLVVRQIYAPYLRKITRLAKKIRKKDRTPGLPSLRRESDNSRDSHLPLAIFSRSTLDHILKRHYFVVVNGRIL